MNVSEPIDAVWTRLFRNAGLIFGERAVFALVNLAALALATNAVGPEAVGALGLLIAFSAAVSTGLSFQSWQAVLRYGAAFRATAPDRLSSLLGATLLADAFAMIATLAAIFALAGALGGWFGVPEDVVAAAPWFAALHLFGQVHMTQVGVLRLYDRVALIAAQHAAIALARLAGALLVWSLSGDAGYVLIAWGAANAVGGVVLWGGAALTLRREAVWPRLGSFAELGLGPREFAGFLSVTNFISTLEAGLHFAMISFVAVSLGLADAGLFHLIRQVSDALARPAEFLAPLIFPDIAGLKARGASAGLKSFVVKATLGAALAVAPIIGLAALFGDEMMNLIFGVDAASIGFALLIAVAASAFFVATFAVEPLILTNGHIGYALFSNAAPWAAMAVVLCLFGAESDLVVAVSALLAHRSTQGGLRLGYLTLSRSSV